MGTTLKTAQQTAAIKKDQMKVIFKESYRETLSKEDYYNCKGQRKAESNGSSRPVHRQNFYFSFRM
jgi:hypothetical protein